VPALSPAETQGTPSTYNRPRVVFNSTEEIQCDTQRPCVPCSRTGVECLCLPSGSGEWRPYRPQIDSPRRSSKKVRVAEPKPTSSPPEQSQSSENRPGNFVSNVEGGTWKSSSTMSLVDGVSKMSTLVEQFANILRGIRVSQRSYSQNLSNRCNTGWTTTGE
jgi:hypothetical protein